MSCSATNSVLKYPLYEEKSDYDDLISHSVILHEYINQPTCSGTIISSTENGTYLLTCSHCVVGKNGILIDNIFIRFGNKFRVFTLIAFDMQKDLALLKNAKPMPVVSEATISNIIPATGDPVCAVGYPSIATEVYLTCGVVSSFNWVFNNYMVSNIYLSGMSGSGVYNDFHELIGVVAGFAKGSNLGFMIPLTEVYDFLEGIPLQ